MQNNFFKIYSDGCPSKCLSVHTSDGIDIETKAKRSFDLPIFSISKRNERTCSKKIKIEKERIKTFQHFFEAKVKRNGMFQKL